MPIRNHYLLKTLWKLHMWIHRVNSSLDKNLYKPKWSKILTEKGELGIGRGASSLKEFFMLNQTHFSIFFKSCARKVYKKNCFACFKSEIITSHRTTHLRGTISVFIAWFSYFFCVIVAVLFLFLKIGWLCIALVPALELFL